MERRLWGEEGLVVGSLRLRMLRGRKGYMVVVMKVRGWWWRRGWENWRREEVVCYFLACYCEVSRGGKWKGCSFAAPVEHDVREAAASRSMDPRSCFAASCLVRYASALGSWLGFQTHPSSPA